MITTSMIYKNTKRLNDQTGALDIAMECADFLEQTGAFVYTNWEDGEVVAGPFISDFHVEITLMYPHKKTPDPDFIARLTKLECMVDMKRDEYKRVYYERNENVKFGAEMFSKKISTHNIWLITIKIPQRYLVLDGNTIFNVDGRDVYYDDLEATYDDDATENNEDSTDDNDDMSEFDL